VRAGGVSHRCVAAVPDEAPGTARQVAPSGWSCEGFVRGCGRHPAGRHVFRAIVTPGHSSGNDHTTNEVDIE
jgi:hypothetical protein